MPTLAMNVFNNAVTEYSNYAFTSLCNFSGKGYGTDATGINRLERGETDNGTLISAKITLAQTNFQRANQKRIRSMFVSAAIENNLLLSVRGDSGHVEAYILEDKFNDLISRSYKVSGRRVNTRSASFAMTIENTAGGYFVLSSIDLLVINLARR